MLNTKEQRLLALDTPLGPDRLLIKRLAGEEGISRLFHFTLDLLSPERGLPFEQIMGQPVTVQIAQEGDRPRYLNGIVNRFMETGQDTGFVSYQAEVVPWLWFLTCTSDCRIFQNMTVPDILLKIFQELGFSDVKTNLQAPYEQVDYCVQYRETDFNFVSRLMEQHGIWYCFEHEAEKHTLLLADNSSGHRYCSAAKKVPWEPQPAGQRDGEVITSLHIQQTLRPGRYALGDYNFESPKTSLAANTMSLVNMGSNGKYEIYDYPGGYGKKAQGDQAVTCRMEEEAQHWRLDGTSNCRRLAAGCQFVLTEHDRRELNTSYVLTEVQHVASGGNIYRSGGQEKEEDAYSNTFTCIPSQVPYRPQRLTPEPVVQGPQTAIVVGKKDEEIWTDQYGRVKVQFHWDREGQRNEHSSCWIRVAQSWAGKRWGTMFLPRVGQEVIVEFLEGNPNQPIITGCVYNAENKPPYELPAEQTKSGIRSCSSKGGNGSNEIRFEDKKGNEELFIHAAKNQANRVEKDSLEHVGQNRNLIVEQDQLELVKGDKHLTIQGDQNEKVNGTVSLEAVGDLQEKVGQKHALDAGTEIHLKAGMNVVIEAGASITLKAGGGFVVIGPSGVAISGTPILLNSGGSAGAGSGASPDAPRMPLEVPAPPVKPTAYSPAAAVLKRAAANGTPFCEKCQAAQQNTEDA